MTDVIAAVIQLLMQVVDLVVTVLVVGVVGLMVLRWVLLKVQPFGGVTFYVRRVTDPLVWPIAQRMPSGMNIAPLILVVVTLLSAFFFKQMIGEVLYSLLGVVRGVETSAPVAMLGWLLYGAVSIFLMLMIMRIVFSWLPFARDTRFMWVLCSLTEPVMAPFRQLIPPLGMFDLSPILLILLMSFVKSAIRNLLIQ